MNGKDCVSLQDCDKCEYVDVNNVLLFQACRFEYCPKFGTLAYRQMCYLLCNELSS